jgi:hypothetical protein
MSLPNGDPARGQGLTMCDIESGHAMTVHVYSPGDGVTLLLNGGTVATGAVTAGRCSPLVQTTTANRC